MNCRAGTDTTPDGGGIWAANAAAAIVAMQRLVTTAITAGHDTVDHIALARRSTATDPQR